jgi:serine/threonine-protein kinase
MEYIEGTKISSFLQTYPDRIDSIFHQTISGFRHLEENGILHRDIRPENIIVSNTGVVKIIDFGFGKKILFQNDDKKSISLNWRYTIPEDFQNRIYDFKTEIYFVGKLFEEVIQDNNIQNFAFPTLLNSMLSVTPSNRVGSFFDIERKIFEGDEIEDYFSGYEKIIYQNFAKQLNDLVSKVEEKTEYVKDIDLIIKNLEDIYRRSMLEDYIQNPGSIAQCFLRGNFYYNKNSNTISVDVLKNFLKFLKSSTIDQRNVIINNLWQRLDSLNRYRDTPIDDLPF